MDIMGDDRHSRKAKACKRHHVQRQPLHVAVGVHAEELHVRHQPLRGAVELQESLQESAQKIIMCSASHSMEPKVFMRKGDTCGVIHFMSQQDFTLRGNAGSIGHATMP